ASSARPRTSDVHPDRRRGQGRHEPDALAPARRARGDPHRAAALSVREARSGVRAPGHPRRRDRDLRARACGHQAPARPARRRDGGRRGQHHHRPDRAREVRRRQRDRADQRPAQPALLRPARGLAHGLGDRRDHGAHRARGPRTRPYPPAGAPQGEPRDRRADDRRPRQVEGQARRRAEAPRRRPDHLGRAERLRRDPGRADAAGGGRPGARDPRAGQGRRAPARAPQGLRNGGTLWAVRRPAPPILLAWFATVAGLISIVSALMPERAGRLDLVQGVLPPGVPGAARTLVLALGLGMVWLSRGLARRKRRAWWLAVALVAASAVAHLARGLDFEEATAHLILLVALFRARRQFVAPGDPTTVRPLLQVGAALAVSVPFLLLLGYETDDLSARVETAFLLLIGALAARGLWLWLRPHHVAPPRGDEHDRAAELVHAHGADSLAYFALRRDQCYFSAPSGRSFLAYRVIAGTALIAGDPIGDAAERHELVAEFVRVAHTKGWRVAVAGVSGDALGDYASLRFKSMYLGDEAVI